jgi:mercuric ion binding protein
MKVRVFLSALLFSLAGLSVSPAFAAMQTVTLSVPGMYCEVCPITVRKALEKVPGVAKVSVSFKDKEALVTFDDAKASIKKLEDATFVAGYPAELKGSKAK